LSDKRAEQFKQQLIEVIAQQELGFISTVIGQIAQQTGLPMQQVAAAAAYLAQRQRPLQLKSDTGKNSRACREKAPAVIEKTGRACIPQADGAVPALRDSRPVKEPRHRDRQDKPGQQTVAPRLKQFPEIPMQRFRIEVGRKQEATPRDIVGAIANEANIDSQYIGHIQLYDEYSTVDLPDGMPRETFRHLRNVLVRGRKLKISLLSQSPGPVRRQKPPRRHQKHSAGKRKRSGKKMAGP